MARRGPKGERFDDSQYLYRIAQLIITKKISAWHAAQRAIDAALPGASDHAKAKRLYAKYQDEFGRYERISGAQRAMSILRLRIMGRELRPIAETAIRVTEAIRSPEFAKMLQMLEDKEFMRRFGHLTPGRGIEIWNLLHPPLRKQNFLQKRR